ncbi:hypothetical protein M8C21_026720 [Ambrosia artemisiifolia]|uniref:FAD-binding PCMH-type domain-containing protein n=1 Tax=Ambrosia artemisiifolia TaxID=4212 RepID=A0AAD5GTT5_AMBAR|nr:hypothetical protein M8C21_026720 [Ambrosia artemisiifolia]
MSSNDTHIIYQTFLQCLQQLSPEPDPDISTIIHSPDFNATTYTTILQSNIRNRRFTTAKTPKPILIITPTKESHVQAAVICAKNLSVQLLTRSGGHDYNGRSYVSHEKKFILLDMFNLHNVSVDMSTKTAVVQTGAQLGELYYRIWEKSEVHGFPAGVCPTVGVGGHVSGGGYGTMIRKYGLSVDHVVDARIVDAEGRVLDRESMGEDLFWAICGGGGASFGVVLSYTVKLVSVPKVNTVFRIDKTVAENAVDLVYKWQSVAPKMDRDLFIRVILMPETVNKKKTVQASFIAHFLGDSDRLLKEMSNTFPELCVSKEDCLEVSWVESVFFWANLDYKSPAELLLDRHSDTVNFLIRKSDYVQTPISRLGWESIFNKLVELGKCGFYLNPYGGIMEEIKADATPCPHRAGNLFKIQYSMNWTEDDPKLDEKYLNQTRVLFEFMTKFVSKNTRGAFLNYRDLDIGVMVGSGVSGYNSGKVYGEKYFKENFDRLVKVKTTVDPDNFFRTEQSIPPLPRVKTPEAFLFSRI